MNHAVVRPWRARDVVFGLVATLGGVAVAVADATNGFGWLGLTLGLVIALFLAWSIGDSFTRRVLVGAFLLRAGLGVAGVYFVSLPDTTADALVFEGRAFLYSLEGVSGVHQHVEVGPYLYSAVIAYLYALVGRAPLLMVAVNVTLGTLLVAEVYRLAADVWSRASARRAIAIAAVFPTLVLYSAITMREAIIALLFITALRFGVKWLKRSKRVLDGSLAVAVGLLLVATALHSGMVSAIIGLAVAAMVEVMARTRRRRFFAAASMGIGAIVLLGALTIVAMTGWGLGKTGGELLVGVETVATAQVTASRGGAAYLGGFQPDNMADIVLQSPVRVLFLFLTPFPWMIRAPSHLVGLADALVFLALFVLFLRRLPHVLRHAPARFLLVVTVMVALAFGLGTSNFGTAIRHRSKLAAPAIVLALAMPVGASRQSRVERHGLTAASPLPGPGDN